MCSSDLSCAMGKKLTHRAPKDAKTKKGKKGASLKGPERPKYVCGQPRYVDRGIMLRGMSTEVLNPGWRTVDAEVSYLGPTGLTIIVRISYSLCRDRSISPYPGWTWSGSPDYPGVAMPGYGSQRFSLSSSICYGIGEDHEVPVRGVLHTYL